MTGKKVILEVEEEFAAAAEETVRLLRVVKELRGEPGCPWDKEQTHDSLKKYLIEESYDKRIEFFFDQARRDLRIGHGLLYSLGQCVSLRKNWV